MTTLYTYTDEEMQSNATDILGVVIDNLVQKNLLASNVAEEYLDTHVIVLAKQSNGFKRWINKWRENFTEKDAFWAIATLPKKVSEQSTEEK